MMMKLVRISTRLLCYKEKTRQYSTSLILSSSLSPIDRLMRVKPAITKEEDNDEYEDDEAFGDNYDNENESDPAFRLGKKLLKLAKVSYRQFDPLPPWVDENRRNISSYRTSAQIRRCLQKWMLEYNRDIQRKFIIKPIGWRKEAMNPDRAAANVKVYGAEDTVAYTNYHFPARFAVMKRVFTEIIKLSPTFKPTNILDFGCGPGTSGAAAMDIWGENLKKYTGVDMSRSMLDAAKVMIEGSNQVSDNNNDNDDNNDYRKKYDRKDRYSRNKDRYSDEMYDKDYTPPCKPDCILWDKSSEIIKRAERTGERYNMTIASYTLAELSSDPTRRAATQMLFELLEVGGYLVIVEQGNPQGSHAVRSARKFILDTFNKTEENKNDDKDNDTIQMILPPPSGHSHDDIGAHVIAPCTHDRPCPLTSGTWCSFSQKAYSGIIRKAAEEKFSYVIIQKTSKTGNQSKLQWTSSSIESIDTSNPTPLMVLQRFLDCHENRIPKLMDDLVDEVDWEEYNPPLYRKEWGRILRSPIKSKGHITSDICMPQGFIGRSTLSRGDVTHIPFLYAALRKATWGGLMPVMDDDSKSPLTKKSKKIIERVEPMKSDKKNKTINYDGDDDDMDEDDEDEEEEKVDHDDKYMKSKPMKKPRKKGEFASLEDFIEHNNNFDDDDDNDDDNDDDDDKYDDMEFKDDKSFNSFKEMANVKDTPILQKVQQNKKSSSKTRSSFLEAHKNRRKK